MLIRNSQDLIGVQAQLLQVAQELQNGKIYDIEIKPHKEKRSLSANNYSWLLQEKISKCLNKPLDEIHKEMVLNYGVLETISVIKDAWESCKRVFDYYMIIGESELNGKTFIHARVGVGTHNYNTAEMSKFINGVVEEAKALDIETYDDKQINELIARWERK